MNVKSIASTVIFLLVVAVSTAQVQFVNNSPDPLLAKISIEHKGAVIVPSLAYRNATPFIMSNINGFDTIVIKSLVQPELKRSLAVVVDGSSPFYVVIQGVASTSSFSPNPDGRNIEVSALALNTSLKSKSPAESEITIQIGCPDAPICSLNALDIAPLIRKSSFGDFSPMPLPMPTISYYVSLVEELSEPIMRRIFDLNLGGHGGTSELLLLSGFWNPAKNNNGSSLALLLVSPDGAVEECSYIVTSVDNDKTHITNQFSTQFDAASDNIYWDFHSNVISLNLYSSNGILAGSSAESPFRTTNLSNGIYYCIAETNTNKLLISRIIICR